MTEIPIINIKNYSLLGTSGIENLGNTCFLNTALQCLAHTMPLTRYILNGDYRPIEWSEGNQMFQNYCRLIVALWEDNCIVAPNSLHKLFAQKCPYYVCYAQHDVQETLAFLIDYLHEELGQLKQPPTLIPANNLAESIKNKAIESEFRLAPKYSIFSNLFSGLEHSRIQCLECKKVSHCFTPFNLLSLELFGSPARRIELNFLINHYCRKDQLDQDNQLKCEKCGQQTQAYKKITFWRLPNFLIISLKRFDNRSRKLYHGINYPLENLDLSKFVTNPEKNSGLYDLYAVGLHQGSSASSGHYTALCKLPNHDWAQFDDSDVTPVENLSYLVQPKDAYLLFYKKKYI